MKAIICGGGTVGHLTPGISIAEIILKQDSKNEVLFIGRENGDENEVIIKKGYRLKTINITKIARKLNLKSVKAIPNIISALKSARKILKEEAPDIVIGTGGYVSWPIIKTAQRLKIPTVMHESNLCPGLATRLLAPRCTRILLNFKQSENEFKRKDNLIVCGNPLPNAFSEITREQARRKLGLSDKDFFILSFGGSGGAEKLNEEVISLMKNHSSKASKVKHVHATGKKYYDKVKEKNPNFIRGYNGCKILPFIDEMPLYMKGADTVISRCGAMTLSEVSACGCVPILIPSPNVTNNHQYKNAKVFTDNGAALMIEESELNERTLLDAVRYLENNHSVREKMKRNLSSFKTENTKEIIINTISGILKEN